MRTEGDERMKIVCYGDSNTYGYDPRSWFGERYEEQICWVERLGINLGCETLNAGLNGREIPRSEEAIIHAGEYLRSLRGDAVLVMLGSNDLLQGASAEEAGARMERFLLQLTRSGETAGLIAPPPMQAGEWPDAAALCESTKLASCYASVAEKLGCPFVDAGEWGIGLCFDGVHFTEEGHRRFADSLAAFLDKRWNAE